MVYIDSWDEFQKAAEDLYVASPYQTRYVSTYRHVDGKLILKVTDDRTVGLSNTRLPTTRPHSSLAHANVGFVSHPLPRLYSVPALTDLKKFERLNKSLMSKMQNRAVASEAEVTEATSTPTPTPAPAPAPVALTASPQLATTSSISTGPQIPTVVAASSLTPASPKTGKKKKGKR
ncbi:hypothetical protein BC937DRAFT_95648 [Endogone sp. FLAS-F59071]|nr:hypothetical protein BC937DRAFT_95648 [Endogone sp. FLAS-F59071]|eukprot:RUS22874.1 hypothetical protein BC937DRAFT_95648 [Endogone sp. FLAS-F59071]